MMPIIKSCLTDDWGPDLRFITCSLTENVLLYLNEMLDCNFIKIKEEQLREFYVPILERLDDG